MRTGGGRDAKVANKRTGAGERKRETAIHHFVDTFLAKEGQQGRGFSRGTDISRDGTADGDQRCKGAEQHIRSGLRFGRGPLQFDPFGFGGCGARLFGLQYGEERQRL